MSAGVLHENSHTLDSTPPRTPKESRVPLDVPTSAKRMHEIHAHRETAVRNTVHDRLDRGDESFRQDEENNLWGSILDSVQSQRAVPVKNLIILGQERTGKSTLLSHLAQHSPEKFLSHEASSSSLPQSTVSTTPNTNTLTRAESTNSVHQSSNGVYDSSADLGLGYSYFDVGDEDGEDIVARVGVYQLSSTSPTCLSLLPFALPLPAEQVVQASKQKNDASSAPASTGRSGPETTPYVKHSPSIESLKDAMFVILLDWEAPWTFLSQLIEWLDVIQTTIKDAVQESSETLNQTFRRLREEELTNLREDLKQYIKQYTEPQGVTSNEGINTDDDIGDTSTASAIVAVSDPTIDQDSASPLSEGCLTHNLGIPIAVVCTKADTIPTLERQRNFKEEQIDYIQQVLRTICLKYGASLFFTAQSRPNSFGILRQYILHRLFTSSQNPSTKGIFSFPYRASTVEKDVLLVPSGWDSFGKIRALREGFDCAGTANGWEWDAEVERIRRERGLEKGSQEAEHVAEGLVAKASLDPEAVSAIRLFEDIIEDWNAGAPALPSNHANVKDPDSQDFLLQQYNNIQKDPELRSRTSKVTATVAQDEESSLSGASVVGPLGSGSLSLPGVDRVLQERLLNDDGRTSKTPMRRTEGRDNTRESGRLTPSSGTRQSNHAHSSAGNSRPTSPLGSGTGATSPGGSQTPKQSEVLHSFFQSLLKDKGPGGNASANTANTAPRSSRNAERRS